MTQSAFKILESKYIPSARGTVTIAEHIVTKTTFIHLHCTEERENFFSACFKTPPTDDTGVPHIIEHCVLAGSEKYPVKDPFMEMIKSSMATFINALTYGDRTVYPCGSLNTKDFKNLISVYMDAVFHPLLKKEIFEQEGYRLDFEEPGNIESSLIHNGVVYNEMTGAYSDPDSYIANILSKNIYPTGSEGKDSGGDPEAITTLTYEEFKTYYTKHYHPTNCCLFALTKLPFDEIANFMGERLYGFKESTTPINYVSQTKFIQPVTNSFPIPTNDSDKCTVISSWMVDDNGKMADILAYSLLEDVLLDNDASPVRKALIDSKLGSGLSMCGYDADSKQKNFLIGLKGVEKKDSQKVFDLINNTLLTAVNEGLDKNLINSMVHRKELYMKKIGGNWPFAMMSTVCSSWVHGQNILEALSLNDILNTLKSDINNNPDMLEKLIQNSLLNNKHRIDSVFYPDNAFFETREKNIQEELQAKKDKMTADELANLAAQSLKLAKQMDEPNTSEQLETLPKLSIADISAEPPSINHKVQMINKKTFLPTEINTGGVCYVDMLFDLSKLPACYHKYLPLFAAMLTRTGTATQNYIELAQEELACSGGISSTSLTNSSTVASINEFILFLKVGSYCLSEDLEKMLNIFTKRISLADFNQPERVLTVTSELLEHSKSSVIPSGHIFANTMAQSGLSAAAHTSNQLSGLPGIKFLSTINNDTIQETIDSLEFIKSFINTNRDAHQILAWSGPESKQTIVSNWLSELTGSKKQYKRTPPPDFTPTSALSGIEINGVTSFSAAVLPGLPIAHPLAAPGIIMMRMLSESFLWDEIRVKKGAYGAGCNLSAAATSFYTYRDPSPANSIRVFNEAISNGFSKLDLKKRAIEDAIIASLKNINPAIRPSMANGIAIIRFIKEMDEKSIIDYRDRILGVDEHSIKEYANFLQQNQSNLRVCVMGSESTLNSLDIKDTIEL